MANKRTFKIHIHDLLASMIFLGKKVTPEDISIHLYNTCWSSEDKYDILGAVQAAFDREMKAQEKIQVLAGAGCYGDYIRLGVRAEDHYGIRKSEHGHLYWLDYNVQD